MNNYIVPDRGSSTGGLVRYLFGPGSVNEHRDQRVIAAADTLGVADGTRLDPVADREEIAELGRQLDSHRKAYGIEVADGQVWHCAISLPPTERLSDAQWAYVARTAVAALGFGEADGHAPCRWVAVHHGQSKEGCEHIHLAVNLVREDGAIASTWRERRIMSRLCGRIEREFGLYVVPRRPGRGMPGYSRAEAERVRRGARVEPDRWTLARTVRACVVASAGEAEFVRRARAAGMLIRPRYAPGGRNEVTGYAVALAPRDPDAAPIWFGGGRLAADLTLPRLRRSWAALSPSPNAAAAREQVLAEWQQDTAEVAARPPNRTDGASTSWGQAAARIQNVCERLAATPDSDTAIWAAAAGRQPGSSRRCRTVWSKHPDRSPMPPTRSPAQLKPAPISAPTPGISTWPSCGVLRRPPGTLPSAAAAPHGVCYCASSGP